MPAPGSEFVLRPSLTSTASPLYTGFQDLNYSSRDIRIAELLPRAFREERGRERASCRLQNVSFGDPARPPEPYTALSYTWGDPERKSAFYLNDMLIRIPENLSEALQHLEQDSSSIKIWADSICIDQENTLEKSNQVAMMAEIFQRASEVLVWLGPAESASEDDFHVLRQLGEATLRLSHQRRHIDSLAEVSEPQGIVDRGMVDALMAEWCLDDALCFDIDSTQRVLQRPWFRRVWVLQEAALNDNVTFYCGRNSISKQVLWAGTQATTILANEFYARNNTMAHSAPTGANFISRRTLNFTAQAKTNSYSLELLLMEVTSNLGVCAYQATDPRDRIFAMRGFLSDSAASAVPTNYTKSCGEVYIEVAEAILSQSHTLDILYAISGPKNVRALPSWVPDWSVAVTSTFGPRKVGRFSAAGPSSHSHPVLTSDKYGNKLLVLSGYSFDSVSTVMEDQWGQNGCKSDFVRALPNFGQQHQTAYLSESDRMDALWKTPIADCDAFFDVLSKIRPEASPRMKQSFEAFVGTVILENDERQLASGPYIQTMNLQSAGRRMFLTSKGYYGLGQETLRPGDQIILLEGGDSPFIAREIGLLGYYELIGEAYVHGIMHGEHLKTRPIVEQFTFC